MRFASREKYHPEDVYRDGISHDRGFDTVESPANQLDDISYSGPELTNTILNTDMLLIVDGYPRGKKGKGIKITIS